MNIENAKENLPLRKLTFTEYGEFREDDNGDKNWFELWHVHAQVCHGGDEQDDFKKFEVYRSVLFKDEEPALAAAVLFTQKHDYDLKIAGEIKLSQANDICWQTDDLVLMQFTVTEYVYGRDSGCSWSDPENDIRKKAIIECMVRQGWKGNVVKWSSGSTSLSPWAISRSYCDCIRIMEFSIPSKEEQKNIVSFEWNDRVCGDLLFRSDDTSVIGTPIDNRKMTKLPFPGDCREERGDRIDVDFLKDYVSWHQRDQIHIVGGNFYLNAEWIFDIDWLIGEVYPDDKEAADNSMIKYAICENSFCGESRVFQFIKEYCPQATHINGDHGNYMMNLRCDD